MKKRYCVTYNYRTSFDALVRANTKKEAAAKVIEVVGDDAVIEDIWEVDGEKAKEEAVNK